MLQDSFHRNIDYARIAVTDRCNLRCHYCMPAGIRYGKQRKLLSLDEIYVLLKVLGEMGFKKLRFTGGEPFLRPNFMKLLQKTQALQSFSSLRITSNGVLIQKHLRELKELGILDINLSLDSLDPKRFQRITRAKHFPKVMEALESMLALGFRIKINSVIMRDLNEEEILPLSLLSKDEPIDVRFIEEMPFNGTGSFDTNIVRAKEIEALLKQAYPAMSKLPMQAGSTTQAYAVPKHKGKIGIIAAYSRFFCGTCNRLRITAKGEIKNCLYDNGIFSMRDYLRQGASPAALAEKIKELLRLKPKDGFEAERRLAQGGQTLAKMSMSTIGG